MAVSYKGLAKPCSEDDFLSEQPATQRIQDVFLAVSADETFGCDAGPGMCWLRHVATRTSEAHGVEVHRLSGQPLPLATAGWDAAKNVGGRKVLLGHFRFPILLDRAPFGQR